jgi:hypothetical protein
MRTKNIQVVISRKVDDWLGSIEDEDFRARLGQNIIVTGGCIASMLLGEKVNDYDIYFQTREVAKEAAEYYVAKFNEDLPEKGLDGLLSKKIWVDDSESDRIKIIVKSAGMSSNEENSEAVLVAGEQEFIGGEDKDEDNEIPYYPLFISPNAITLSGKIQLVFRFYGTAAEIHENYDFVHCTNYWTKEDGLMLNKKALESLLTKDLMYVGSLYPVCSVMRTRKFLQRGWIITAGQYLKMCFQVSQLDLTDQAVLEDQLIGVDVTYFMEVIEKLEEQDDCHDVEQSYLFEILDKMF